MTPQDTPNRDLGPELGRLVLMAMIVMHHLLVHGLGLGKLSVTPQGSLTPGLMLYGELALNSFLFLGVNTFMLLSGFYGMRFKSEKFAQLLFSASLYSLGIFLLAKALGLYAGSPYPSQYWFLVCYLGVYVLSPFVQLLLDQLDDHRFGVLIGIGAILVVFLGYHRDAAVIGAQNGYSLIHLLFCYTLGRFLARHKERLSKLSWTHLASVQFFSWLGIFSFCVFRLYQGKYGATWSVFSYNNAFAVIGACSLLLIFLRLRPRLALIGKLSPLVLAVYLIHDHLAMRQNVIEYLAPRFIDSPWDLLWCLPLLGLVILFACLSVEFLVQALTSRIWKLPRLSRLFSIIDSFLRGPGHSS